MKEIPSTYRISSETANMLVQAYENLSRNPTTVETTDQNIDLVFETYSFGGNERPKAVLKGIFHDKWGKRTCLYLRDLTAVQIEDGALVVSAEGVKVCFNIG